MLNSRKEEEERYIKEIAKTPSGDLDKEITRARRDLRDHVIGHTGCYEQDCSTRLNIVQHISQLVQARNSQQ